MTQTRSSQPPDGRAPKRRPQIWGALLATCLAAFGLAVLFVASGATIADFLSMATRVPLWGVILIALAQAAIILLSALRWRLLLQAVAQQDAPFPMHHATAATTLAVLAGQVLPIQVCTPIIRAWYAARFDVPILRAFGTSALEQTFQLLVLACAAMTSFLFLLPIGGVLLDIVGACLFAIVLLLGVRFLIAFTARVLSYLATGTEHLVSRVAGHLHRGFQAASALPVVILTRLTGLSLLGYAVLAGLNVILLAFISGIPPIPLLIAYPLVLFLMSLPFFPAGLGVVELTWAGVLAREGLPFDQAVTAALTLRVVSTLGFLMVAPLLLSAMAQRIGGER